LTLADCGERPLRGRQFNPYLSILIIQSRFQKCGRMAQNANRATRSNVALPIRHVTAVLAGNALEFYDFSVYSFFALQIGRAFFPSQNALSSLLLSLATFGAGFLTRPIGAVLIGRIADRTGRRKAMMLTFTLMGVAIVGMALTPNHQSIGTSAPILIICWRLLQGFALGGEVGPSTAFLVEASPNFRRGLYGSLQLATQSLSVFVAGLVGFSLSHTLDERSLDIWGWRVAFLLGAAIVPIGLLIRRSLPETLHLRETAIPLEPAATRSIGRVATLGLLLLLAGTVLTYVKNYLTTYSVHTLGMSSRVAFTTTMINGIASVSGYLLGGWLSDKFGRKPIMIIFSGAFIVAAMPAFYAINLFRTPTTLYGATAALALLVSLREAPLLTALAESLPRRIRAGALGVLYAVAISVFGGTTQFIVAWLIGVTGNALVPGWYMTAAGTVGLLAALMFRETAPVRARAPRSQHE
jgi:MFS transporter, MHS family, citrate/tricarballylate:H+ symporter